MFSIYYIYMYVCICIHVYIIARELIWAEELVGWARLVYLTSWITWLEQVHFHSELSSNELLSSWAYSPTQNAFPFKLCHFKHYTCGDLWGATKSHLNPKAMDNNRKGKRICVKKVSFRNDTFCKGNPNIGGIGNVKPYIFKLFNIRCMECLG